MDREEIRAHWNNWSETYGAGLRATTKSWTSKAIELDALGRRIEALVGQGKKHLILEAGCGNGTNCLELAKRFPEISFHGFDFVPGMVTAARQRATDDSLESRVSFFEADVLDLDSTPELAPQYGIVFTNRCLINLNTIDLQKEAVSLLAERVISGGYLLMIENSQQTYATQNQCRSALGLSQRTPAAFNTFFDEAKIRPHLAAAGLELEDVEDFSSLHDLVLYALVPAINGGEVDYDHPLVEAATRLSIETSSSNQNAFGAFGQNRLFVCRRTR